MNKTLDFSIRKKQHLVVILPDDDKTKLLVTMPNKKLFDDIVSTQRIISVNEEELDGDSIEELFALCANILSRNKNKIMVSPELLEEYFDFEDIVVLFTSYVSFISEVTNTKN